MASVKSIGQNWLSGRLEDLPFVGGEGVQAVFMGDRLNAGFFEEFDVRSKLFMTHPLKGIGRQSNAWVRACFSPGTIQVKDAHALVVLCQMVGRINAALIASDDEKIIPLEFGVGSDGRGVSTRFTSIKNTQ